MRAISVHQPWAALIASGRKTIETRRWATTHRGPLLFVSTLRPRINRDEWPRWMYESLKVYGHALALATVETCRKMTADDVRRSWCPFVGQWAWVLRDIRRVRPFAVRGKQMFYDVDDALIEVIS